MNKTLLDKLNGAIVIGPSQLRSYFVMEKNKNVFLNFSYSTKEEVLSELFGITNQKGVLGLMTEFNLSYDEANAQINYICRGMSNNKYYDYLNKNKLLYKDEYYKNLYNKKHILFVSYDEKDSEIKHIIEELKLTDYEFIKNEDLGLETNDKKYLIFSTKDEEVRYALNEIANKVANGMKPSDFVIYCNTVDYAFYLKTYSYLFKLPLNIRENYSLYDTYSAKIIMNHMDEDFDKFVSKSGALFTNDKENFELIKYLYHFYKLSTNKNKVMNFVSILKDYPIKKEKFLDGALATSSLTFSSTKEIYVLGAIDGFVPKVEKNNDFIDDKIKSANKLSTSSELNSFNKKMTVSFFNWNNVKSISFPTENGTNKLAYLLDENGFKEKPFELNLTQYSKELAELYYYDYLLRLKNFNVVDNELNYLDGIFDYKTKYDNSFKGINRIVTEKPKHSYTSMEQYSECPFAYYANRILGLGTFEESTAAKLGKYAHKILEGVYDTNFNFEVACKNAYKEQEFTKQEDVLLITFNEQLKITVNLILEHYKMNPFISTEHEYKITGDCGKFILEGQIDRLLVYKEGIAIIDYKTGHYSARIEDFKDYGLYLQLPTYLYLTQFSEELKNKSIIGLFIQPLVCSSFYNFQNPTKDQTKAIMMNGTVNKNSKIYEDFDKSVEKNDSSLFVRSVRLDSSNSISKPNVKDLLVYNNDQFAEIRQKAIEYYNLFNDAILANKFDIAPYYIKKKCACDYCGFKDICFMTKKDYRILDKEKDIDDKEENDEEGDEDGND